MSNLRESLAALLDEMQVEYNKAVKESESSLQLYAELRTVEDVEKMKKIYTRVKQIKAKQFKQLQAIRNQPLASQESFENMEIFFDKPVLHEHRQLHSAQRRLKRAFLDLYQKIQNEPPIVQGRESAGGTPTGSDTNVP